MQGLKENRKNLKKWDLFAVCMHTAKDHLVTLAEVRRTAKHAARQRYHARQRAKRTATS
jgi:hypothetical protein